MLYHQTYFTHHNYAIHLTTIYTSTLIYTTKHTLHFNIMLYHQKQCWCLDYAITQITLHVSPLHHTIKHTVHVTIMLYNERISTSHHYTIQLNRLYMSQLRFNTKNSTCHNYAIPTNTLYMLSLCYITWHTVHVSIILYQQTHCACRQCDSHYKYIIYHINAILRSRIYMSPICYTI